MKGFADLPSFAAFARRFFLSPPRDSDGRGQSGFLDWQRYSTMDSRHTSRSTVRPALWLLWSLTAAIVALAALWQVADQGHLASFIGG